MTRLGPIIDQYPHQQVYQNFALGQDILEYENLLHCSNEVFQWKLELNLSVTRTNLNTWEREH